MWMARPECMVRSPLPARVVRPSIKSTPCGVVGRGKGSQRSWLGGVSTSLKAVGQGAAVEQARRGEGAAAELLGVEAERGFLGGILADGKGVGNGLGGVLVAEAGEELEIGHGDPLCS